jgi:hypothetical protein
VIAAAWPADHGSQTPPAVPVIADDNHRDRLTGRDSRRRVTARRPRTPAAAPPQWLVLAVRVGEKPVRPLVAYFGCIYYAGTRPAEAADLHLPDCQLPGRCLDCDAHLPDLTTVAPSRRCRHEKTEPVWGRITLAETNPETGSHWTDDGTPYQRRGLKHRARTVPIPPPLVALLCDHVRGGDGVTSAGTDTEVTVRQIQRDQVEVRVGDRSYVVSARAHTARDAWHTGTSIPGPDASPAHCTIRHRPGLFTGFKGYFVADLAHGVALDISGDGVDSGEPSVSWRHCFLPVAQPVEVLPHDQIDLLFTRRRPDPGEAGHPFGQIYRRAGQVTRDNAVVSTFAHSTARSP